MSCRGSVGAIYGGAGGGGGTDDGGCGGVEGEIESEDRGSSGRGGGREVKGVRGVACGTIGVSIELSTRVHAFCRTGVDKAIVLGW